MNDPISPRRNPGIWPLILSQFLLDIHTCRDSPFLGLNDSIHSVQVGIPKTLRAGVESMASLV